jgi:hypothetical protein
MYSRFIAITAQQVGVSDRDNRIIEEESEWRRAPRRPMCLLRPE